MRTTITLDPDVLVLVRGLMKKKGLTFKAVINQALREGLSKHRPRGSRPYRQRTFHMGFRPDLPIDKALAVTAGLEDGEIIRKLTDRN